MIGTRRAALGLVFAIALSPLAAASAIYVDASAPPGGDGTSPATAYQTIRAAVTDANARPDGATIRVAEGTYTEAPNLTITRGGVKIIGSTVLALDAGGLPTGAVTQAARVKPASAGTLVRVRASDVEISGIVFDGGLPRPSPGPGGSTLLGVDGVDGAAARRSLAGISIHGNCFQDAAQGLMLRLASATIAGNFFGRNGSALASLAGFAADAEHPGPEQQVTFEGNRVVDSVNLGVAFLGFVGSRVSPTFAAGPGASHVVVANNDFARNGDARDPFLGVFYPQPIQYAALLFNPCHSDNCDPLQANRISATIAGNTFTRNGYAISVSQRVRADTAQQGHVVDLTLFENRYCASGLNDLFVNFGLNAQSHGTTGAGAAFRYAVDSICTIDATGDRLSLDDVDYDHPLEDPRLPATAPGTLVLGNTFVFNHEAVPPTPTQVPPAVAPTITRPPESSPGVFAAIVTQDSTPPAIDRVLASPSVLWPPDRKMVPVAIAVEAVDGCDLAPASEIISVSSNQGAGPGSSSGGTGGGAGGGAEPDWEITGALSLRLRAERGGHGAGRVYTITVRSTDAAGNAATAAVTVTVPHDQGR